MTKTNTEAVEALDPRFADTSAVAGLTYQTDPEYDADEDGNPLWKCEICSDGGHAIVAEVYGANEAEAKARGEAIARALSHTAKTEPSAAGLAPDFLACLSDYDDVKNETAEARLAAFAYDNRQAILAALSAPTRERELLEDARVHVERARYYSSGPYEKMAQDVLARIDNLLNEGSGQ